MQTYSGGNLNMIGTSTALALNTWYHVVGVTDGTIYFNGVAQHLEEHFVGGADQGSPNARSATLTGATSVTRAFNYIGKGNTAGTFMNGTMDEVRVWNDARTQAEIQANMYTPLKGNETDLAGYWNFDEGSGNVATDRSANTLTGWATNFALTGSSSNYVSASINVEVDSSTSLAIIDMGGGDTDNIGATQTDTVTPKIITLPTKGTLYQTTDGTTSNGTAIAAGDLVAHADGKVIYVATAGSSGSDSYTYQVNDGTNNSANTETVTITYVQPVAGFGNALDLDGTNDHVSLGSPSELALGTGDFSYEAWIKTDNTTNTRADIIQVGNNSVSGQGGFLFMENGVLEFDTADSSNATASTLINDQRAHHVAITRTGSTIKLYVDGILEFNNTIDASPNLVAGPSTIGATSDGSSAFNGQIDEVRIWNDVRTDAEINANMFTPLKGNETGLVGYWNFDEGSGTTTTDRSANTNDGSVRNLALSGANSNWVTSPFTQDTVSTGVASVIDLGGGDADNDGATQTDTVTPKVSTLPTAGTLYQTTDGTTSNGTAIAAGDAVTNANGLVIYVPNNSGLIGTDSFTYQVNDGTTNSDNTATANITYDAAAVVSTKFDAATGWTLSSDATNDTTNDTTNDRLQLTAYVNAATNQSGMAVFDTAYSSAQQFEFEFDYHIEDTDGGDGRTVGDGIAFFVMDGSTTAAIGSLGGALGYSTDGTVNGMAGGWLGVGFDAFGNFSALGTGGSEPNSTQADNVVLRGSGTGGTTGYEYLSGSAFAASIDSASNRKVNIVLTSDQKITVKISSDVGETWTTIIDNVDVKNATDQASVPTTFKFGFTGTSGDGAGALNFIDKFVMRAGQTAEASTGSNAVTENDAAAAIDGSLNILNIDRNIDSATVTISSGFQSNQDTLAFTDQNGITGSWNSSTGVLTLTGATTSANYQTALRTVTYVNSSDNPDTTNRSITYAVTPTADQTISSNAHFYEYVASGMDWDTAKVEAENSTLFGLQGYLATITSAAENTFIDNLIGTGEAVWIGAADDANRGATEGNFFWIAGPEDGTQFWTGGSGGSAVSSGYQNWDTGPNPSEPNNSSSTEHFAAMNVDGTWNDATESTFTGYVVEYGGQTGDAAAAAVATIKTVTIAAVNDAPTTSDLSKSADNNTTITFAAADFAGAFSDLESDSLNKIQVTALPTDGTLKLSGTDVSVDDEITSANIANLTFVPGAFSGTTTFGWKGHDGTTFAAGASLANLTIAQVAASGGGDGGGGTGGGTLGGGGTLTGSSGGGDTLTGSSGGDTLSTGGGGTTTGSTGGGDSGGTTTSGGLSSGTTLVTLDTGSTTFGQTSDSGDGDLQPASGPSDGGGGGQSTVNEADGGAARSGGEGEFFQTLSDDDDGSFQPASTDDDTEQTASADDGEPNSTEQAAGAGNSDENENTVSGTLGNQGNDKDVGNAGGQKGQGGGKQQDGEDDGEQSTQAEDGGEEEEIAVQEDGDADEDGDAGEDGESDEATPAADADGPSTEQAAGAGDSDENSNTVSGTQGNQGNDLPVGNAGGQQGNQGGGQQADSGDATDATPDAAPDTAPDTGNTASTEQAAGAGGSDENSNTTSGTLGNQGNDLPVGNAGGQRGNQGGNQQADTGTPPADDGASTGTTPPADDGASTDTGTPPADDGASTDTGDNTQQADTGDSTQQADTGTPPADDGASTDTGTPPADDGASTDTGTPPADDGASTDTGDNTQQADTGTPPADDGASTDTGSPPADDGASTDTGDSTQQADTGTPPADDGASTDTGTPPADDGASTDTGTPPADDGASTDTGDTTQQANTGTPPPADDGASTDTGDSTQQADTAPPPADTSSATGDQTAAAPDGTQGANAARGGNADGAPDGVAAGEAQGGNSGPRSATVNRGGEAGPAPGSAGLQPASGETGAAASQFGLNANLPDVAFSVGSELSFGIPENAFDSSGKDNRLTYEAKKVDGSELPIWLKFDNQTGAFSGTPPETAVGEVDIRIVATDEQGRTAESSFKLRLSSIGKDQPDSSGGTGENSSDAGDILRDRNPGLITASAAPATGYSGADLAAIGKEPLSGQLARASSIGSTMGSSEFLRSINELLNTG